MKKSFYPMLAIDGIKKNKRLYVPYILTCIGMVMMYYIVIFLRYTETIKYLPGSGTVGVTLVFGGFVIAVFSALFLFYTNSFLMRRRKKEFGLYNILGMGKKNISRILLWEAVIISAVAIGAGLVFGVILSKLAELTLLHILELPFSYSLSISGKAIANTVVTYLVIFLVLLLNGIRQIGFSNTIELLKSENTGEKPPKGNRIIGILGVIILAAAYYIAVEVADPVSALLWFFVAVLMVIAATYMLFITGSVVLCKILQKNKKFYYKPNHFVSVASMVYRMKRNGAGLASVCILMTMVLVTVSSTTCLYFGAEGALESRYPLGINTSVAFADMDSYHNGDLEKIKSIVDEEVEKQTVVVKEAYDFRSVKVSGLVKGDSFEYDYSNAGTGKNDGQLVNLRIVPLEDYNRCKGVNEKLAKGQAIICTFRAAYDEKRFNINGGQSFDVVKVVDGFVPNGDASMEMFGTVYLIVPDIQNAIKGLDEVKITYGDSKESLLSYCWQYEFNTEGSAAQEKAIAESSYEKIRALMESEPGMLHVVGCDSKEANRLDFFQTFGSLLFIGMILSIVFIVAAALIIYYKQISEGYEDQSRFESMQKVGMTKIEIRKSINSQLLTVFFAPLIAAGLHLAFAFPMISQILKCFSLNNVWLFGVTTVITFAVFGIVYVVIYKITSNAYYNIVSGV